MRDLGKKNFHREAVEEKKKKKKKKKKIQCVVSGLFWILGCFDFVFFCLCMSLRLCFVGFRAFGCEYFLVGNFEREK
jgi:hypothetical protein